MSIRPTKYDIIQDDRINLLNKKINSLSGSSQTIFIQNDNLDSQIDGINQTFDLVYNYLNNSTKIYYNGQRLIKGIDYTEIGSNQIFLNTVLTKGKLRADYLAGNTSSNPEIIINEVPFGLINSINNIFSTSQNYLTSSTELYYNGQKLILNDDYIELNNFQIEMLFIPKSGAKIIIDYIRN